MNVFSFVGNLGRDCETRYLPDGTAVVNFTVAAKSGYGEKAVTTWVTCHLWGKRGEGVAPYLTKGQQVCVSGELTNRPYTDKAGVEKYSLELRVSDVTLTGSKGDSPKPDALNQAQAEPETNNPKPGFDDFEDAPF